MTDNGAMTNGRPVSSHGRMAPATKGMERRGRRPRRPDIVKCQRYEDDGATTKRAVGHLHMADGQRYDGQ